METFCTLTAAILLSPWITTSAIAGISYQSVRFIHNPPVIRPPAYHHHHAPPPPPPPTHIESNTHFDHYFDDLWPNTLFDVPDDFFDVTLNSPPPISHGDYHHQPSDYLHHHHHHHEQFSNDLDYTPDPYLLTGQRAKQAADYLYSKQLFFSAIPHAKALLRLQAKRAANGLQPNRLSSINPRSPFYREKQPIANHYHF